MKVFTFLLISLCVNALADARRSGYEFMSRETQAIQDDEMANPGMLWVLDGEALWKQYGCGRCHADMKGVAARYPAFDERRGRLLDLEGRVNVCRTERQGAPALPRESKELLALTAYIARQSHGMPIAVGEDARTRKLIAAGKARYKLRQGQLNLSCSQCHDANWGRRLAGTVIPQAHPTGYPLYRLEWQTLGSLQRRLRNCLIGVRAQPYDYGSPELVELELYLMSRARGMKIEAPAVRP